MIWRPLSKTPERSPDGDSKRLAFCTKLMLKYARKQIEFQKPGHTMKVDLIETIQLSESVVGGFVDALGYSVVAELSVGGFFTVFEVAGQRVDHWR